MNEYDVSLHGDYLEKVASSFIKSYFPNYELVWKTYIGNRGNETKAVILGYEDDDKRQKFAERSYTILESMFMASKILESQTFASPINSLDAYIDFNTKYMAFFSHLGRIKDNVSKAYEILKLSGNVDEIFKEYFEARNIVLHGKTVPLFHDENGFPQMPTLYSSITNSRGWTDKGFKWEDSAGIQKVFVDDICKKYFIEIKQRVNDAYGNFYDVISKELKVLKTRIFFEYPKTSPLSNVSSSNITISNTSNGVSIYNIQLPK